MSVKVITIAQQKGGAGKTTIAAHIAVALNQKGKRVAVVDIDPQGSLSYWHKKREEKFGEGYTGLEFSSITGWRVNSEISRLKKDVDFIVIDSPPHTETESKTAIRAADLIIIPVQPSPTDLWATKATFDIAEKEKKNAFILLNRVAHNSKLAEKIASELPGPALKATLGSRVSFAACLLDGRTVTETDPTSAAASEIKTLTNEILGIFKVQEKVNEKLKGKTTEFA